MFSFQDDYKHISMHHAVRFLLCLFRVCCSKPENGKSIKILHIINYLNEISFGLLYTWLFNWIFQYLISGNWSSFWSGRPPCSYGSNFSTHASLMLDTKFEISITDFHVGKYSTNARIRINIFLLTSGFTGYLGKKSICRLVSIQHISHLPYKVRINNEIFVMKFE